jgi:hypothetical protein
MSNNLAKPARETRLGNLTAKSVLMLLADLADSAGFCYPSLAFIAHSTEISRRTVERVIQVFVEIEIIARVDRGPTRVPGIQLNTALLGTDLHTEFAACFRTAQGRTSGSGMRLRDAEENVSETLVHVSKTRRNVSETVGAVSETFPPHPHIGRPAIEPLETHPHIPHIPKPCLTSPVSVSESFLIKRAAESVMQACGFTSTKLSPVIRRVLQRGADIGAEPATTALAMIDAWRKFVTQGDRLRFKWTAERFFSEGYWNKPGAWPWDAERLDAEERAKY